MKQSGFNQATIDVIINDLQSQVYGDAGNADGKNTE